jgi:hypothetical protein
MPVMKKQEALSYISTKTRMELDSQNTVFANVGKHKDSWWLEPSNKKFDTGFYFILNDEDNRQFLLFKVPKGIIDKSRFRQRAEKGVSQIIIPVSASNYVDKRGFSFNQYLIRKIEY